MKKFLLFALISAITALLTSGCGSSSSDSAAAEKGTLEVVGGAINPSPPTAPALGGPQSLAAEPPPEGGCLECSPTSVKLDIRQIWLGANADCTDLAKAIDNGDAVNYVEMTADPTLFDGDVDPGNYNCMAFKMSDIIKFTPNTAAIAWNDFCEMGNEYDHDIFKAQTTGEEYWYSPETPTVLTLAEGSSAAPVAQDVFIYFTTNLAAALGANADLNEHQTLEMNDTISILALQRTMRKLWFDFTSQVIDDDGACTLESPEVGFSVIDPS